MQIDIQTAGDHAAAQLQKLHGNEHGRSSEAGNSVAVTILKILTIIAGIFFAMVSATSLPPDLAFISITLIIVTVAALVTGSEKIVAIFPRNIWFWRGHYPAPATIQYYEPAPQPWYRRPWTSLAPWRQGTQSAPLNTGGHSVHSTTKGAGRSPRPAASSAPRSHLSQSLPSQRHTPAGGGHSSSPYAGGTQNVAVGSKRHDDRSTTPGGQVIPGSRKRKR